MRTKCRCSPRRHSPRPTCSCRPGPGPPALPGRGRPRHSLARSGGTSACSWWLYLVSTRTTACMSHRCGHRRSHRRSQAQGAQAQAQPSAAKRRARRHTGAGRAGAQAQAQPGAAKRSHSHSHRHRAHRRSRMRDELDAPARSRAVGRTRTVLSSQLFQLSWAVEFVRSMATNYFLPPTRRNGFRAVVSAAAGRGGGVGCVPFLPARLAHAITSLQCFVCAVGAVVCRLLPLPAPAPSRRRGARRACAPSRRGRAPCELRGGCMAWQASACGVA